MARRNQGRDAYQEAGWESLANAIVAQASKDYVESLSKTNQKRTGKEKLDPEEIKKFFRSHWCEMLTDLDPEYLISELDKRVSA